MMSEIQGGNFGSGFAAGAVSSLVSSGIQSLGEVGIDGEINGNKFAIKNEFGNTDGYKAIILASGGLSGGLASSIAGGNFMDGVKQGLITSGLNHLAHMSLGGEDPGKGFKKETVLDKNGAVLGAIYSKMITIEGGVRIMIGFKTTPTGKKFQYQIVQNLTTDSEKGYNEALKGTQHFDPSQLDPHHDNFPFYFSSNDYKDKLIFNSKTSSGYNLYFEDTPSRAGSQRSFFYMCGETSLVSYTNSSLEILHTYNWSYNYYYNGGSSRVNITMPLTTSQPSSFQSNVNNVRR
jgi:hypothetical protein